MGSQSYRDLIGWQKSIDLCVDIYKACEAFPKSEMYDLADQMKRAAVSISSNTAEGQGRQHPREFLHFISTANGSLAELDTQRIIAENLHFIGPDTSASLDNAITEIHEMLYTLRTKLKTQI